MPAIILQKENEKSKVWIGKAKILCYTTYNSGKKRNL